MKKAEVMLSYNHRKLTRSSMTIFMLTKTAIASTIRPTRMDTIKIQIGIPSLSSPQSAIKILAPYMCYIQSQNT